MVCSLLEKDSSAILAYRLESFSKDRVQGLFKDGSVVVPIDRLNDHNLESLEWVVQRCCIVEIDGCCAVEERDCL